MGDGGTGFWKNVLDNLLADLDTSVLKRNSSKEIDTVVWKLGLFVGLVIVGGGTGDEGIIVLFVINDTTS